MTKLARPLLLLLALGTAMPVLAQSEEMSNAGLRFVFAPPGARSRAMGGTFIASANDATAAFSNPAGLALLRNREFAAEGNYRSVVHKFPGTGRADGTAPSGEDIDVNRSVLAAGNPTQQQVTLSYLAIVLPLAEGVTVAGYYHQPLRMRYSAQDQGGFLQDQDSRFGYPQDVWRTWPYAVASEGGGGTTLETVGLSAGFKVTDNLSLGVGATLGFFTINAATQLNTRPTDLVNKVGGCGNPLGCDPWSEYALTSAELFGIIQSDSGGATTSVGFTTGLLWDLTSRVSVGATYRYGGSYDYESRFCVSNRSVGETPIDDGLCGLGLAPTSRVDSTFNVPHVLGVGLTVALSETLQLSADYRRTQYSRLTSDFTSVFSNDVRDGMRSTDADLLECQVEPCLIDMLDPMAFKKDDFYAKDSNDFHFGAEYALLNLRNQIFLRAGFYTQQDSRIRYRGPTGFRSFYWNNDFETGTVSHGTVGAGVLLGQVQIDIAADFAKDNTMVVASLVSRF